MKFKVLRMNRGFKTAKEFAEKLGFSQARISKWETGEAKPKIKDLDRVAEALGVSIEEVLDCFK